VPPKKDADTGTPEEEVVYDDAYEDAVAADESVLEQELASLPPNVMAALGGLMEEVRELRAAVAEQTAEPEAEFIAEPVALPEGTRRYVNWQYKEETLIMQAGRTWLVDGEKVWVPQKDVTFHGGLYTTDDPEEIEFLERHEAYGVRIYRDDSAVPQYTGPGLSTGVRDSGSSPRNPLAAPMG